VLPRPVNNMRLVIQTDVFTALTAIRKCAFRGQN
jgi:hypothetical protein